MRIGVDAKNLIGSRTGISRYIIEMCRELAKTHQLFLYLPHDPQIPLPEIKNITYRIGHARGLLKRIYWSHFILPHLAEKDQIDLFWGPAHRLPARLKTTIPTILTIHDLTWKYAPQTMHWKTRIGEILWMEKALAKADDIISVSQATAQQLQLNYPQHANKIHVIYPGFTAAAYQANDHEDAHRAAEQAILTNYGLTANYILFVGTLEPRKNLHRLLEAYAALPKSLRTDFPLVIAGGQGWRLKNLDHFITELNLHSHIVLTGFISDETLSVLYKNAYFLAMPSIYEGFGLPIIEAQSAGVPVLTSKSSSMPEAGGQAAYYINPLSVSSMTDGLRQLFENHHLYQQLKTAAPINAAKFQWQQSAKKFDNLIQRHFLKQK